MFSHVNKRTQYERPTAASCSDNAVALTSFGNHKQNGVNYHYQQAGTSSSGLTNGHGALPNGNGRAQPDGLYEATAHTHNGWQQANGGHGATKGLPGAGARKPPIAPSSMPAHQNGTRKHMEPAGTHNYYAFTTDPAQLRGQLITTRIRKGDKGLGFTLIGNDGNNVAPEFIQVSVRMLGYERTLKYIDQKHHPKRSGRDRRHPSYGRRARIRGQRVHARRQSGRRMPHLQIYSSRRNSDDTSMPGLSSHAGPDEPSESFPD